MADYYPIKWGDDPLSKMLAALAWNERETSIRLSTDYELLQQLNKLFLDLLEAVEQDNKPELDIPRILMSRTYASLLATLRIAMGGQIIESLPLLRSAIEQAWYALHIGVDPDPPARTTIWKDRDKNDKSLNYFKKEFTVGNVRKSHQQKDPSTEKQLHSLYEFCICFGGHPNPKGILGTVIKSEMERAQHHKIGILYPSEETLSQTFRGVTKVAIGILKVFQLLYPERFMIMSLDKEIEELETLEMEKWFRQS